MTTDHAAVRAVLDQVYAAWAADDADAFVAPAPKPRIKCGKSGWPTPTVDRVRRCAGHDCNALFLDSSRPGTRRWCSMNTCGNQAKKVTLRSRRARS